MSRGVFGFTFGCGVLWEVRSERRLLGDSPRFRHLTFAILTVRTSTRGVNVSPSRVEGQLSGIKLVGDLVRSYCSALRARDQRAITDSIIRTLGG